MKYVATVAVMLTLGVPGVYTQERPVKMTFSGTNVATTNNLRPGTSARRTPVAGHSWLGALTFRELLADQGGASPSPRAPALIFWLSLERAYFASKTEVC